MGRKASNPELKEALAILLAPEQFSPGLVAWAEDKLPMAAKARAKCECHDGHWVWNAAHSTSGAPVMRAGGNMRPVRLVLWEELHERRAPAGHSAAARCNVDGCVSPGCIGTISRSVLMREVAQTGVFASADRCRKIALIARARSHVTDEQVAAVRAADLPARDAAAREALARELGVSRGCINQWRAGALRTDFTDPFAGLGKR